MGVFVEYLLMIAMFLAAIFLIVLVLVQRGRGGGLAGALGGMGGQSAFGTKAGDVFTKITIGVAAAWILMCVLAVKLYSTSDNQFTVSGAEADQQTTEGNAVGPLPTPGAAPGTPPSEPGAENGDDPAGRTPASDSPASTPNEDQ
jgi:preprotein translocase subunit SecG